MLRDDASAQNGERHWRSQSSITARRTQIQSSNPDALFVLQAANDTGVARL